MKFIFTQGERNYEVGGRFSELYAFKRALSACDFRGEGGLVFEDMNPGQTEEIPLWLFTEAVVPNRNSLLVTCVSNEIDRPIRLNVETKHN